MKTNTLIRRNPRVFITLAALFVTAIMVFFCCQTAMAKERAFRDYGDDVYGYGRETIRVTLTGVTNFELMELFHDIIINTPGVVEARRCRLHIDPRRPQASYVLWSVTLADLDITEFESRVYRMARYMSGHMDEFGEPAFSIEPDQNLRTLLAFIRPWRSSAQSLEFILERPLLHRGKNANGTYGRYRHWHTYGDTGFE